MAHTGPQQQLAGSFPRESESLLFHVRKILDDSWWSAYVEGMGLVVEVSSKVAARLVDQWLAGGGWFVVVSPFLLYLFFIQGVIGSLGNVCSSEGSSRVRTSLYLTRWMDGQ